MPPVLGPPVPGTKRTAGHALREPVHFWEKLGLLPEFAGKVPGSALRALRRSLPESGLALELRTRELFTECLVSLGAVKKDMDVFTVSREDIERLVGE